MGKSVNEETDRSPEQRSLGRDVRIKGLESIVFLDKKLGGSNHLTYD